jgi:dTDP-glucose 4,6-dehydratase
LPVEKTILITGGAGFIGSNFIQHLYQCYPDYNLLILDQLTYAGSVLNLPMLENSHTNSRITFWYGNVRNAELVNTLVEQADIVVHFAAETHVTRSIYDNLLFYETDVLGTQALANAVLKYGKKVERFIHISTSEVYGTAVTEKMAESHPLNPMSPYASAKCGADRLVYSYWATYNIPAVIVRPFNNYGPRQHLEKVVPRFITSVILNEPLTIHGDGLAARDFIHVSDCCRALDLILHAPAEAVTGQEINLATGQHRTILSIAQDVIRLMSYNPSQMVYVGDRPAQVFRHTGDWSKINRILGWEPTIEWEKGLSDTIEWFQNNRTWWERQIWMRHIPIVTKTGKIEYH